MARAEKITSKGVAERHAEALAKIAAPGDVALVVRGVARSIAIMCPDGCGEVISVNLDKRTGPAWRLYERDGRLTLYPSVWRPSGCEAHFILWHNRVIWCDGSDDLRWDDGTVKERVFAALPPSGAEHVHFERLAKELELTPWECLWACQSLEREGLAAASERRTNFGRGGHCANALSPRRTTDTD